MSLYLLLQGGAALIIFDSVLVFHVIRTRCLFKLNVQNNNSTINFTGVFEWNKGFCSQEDSGPVFGQTNFTDQEDEDWGPKPRRHHSRGYNQQRPGREDTALYRPSQKRGEFNLL